MRRSLPPASCPPVNRLRFLLWLGLGLGTFLILLGVLRPAVLRSRLRLIRLLLFAYAFMVVGLAALEVVRRVTGFAWE